MKTYKNKLPGSLSQKVNLSTGGQISNHTSFVATFMKVFLQTFTST